MQLKKHYRKLVRKNEQRKAYSLTDKEKAEHNKVKPTKEQIPFAVKLEL